jgi:hypothetical protein
VRFSSARLRAAVITLVMLGGTLMAPVAASAAPRSPAAVPDVAGDAASAMSYAREGDKPVLVESKTTETAQTFANPDGSWTLTEYTHPVRVHQAGAWTPVDTTLVKRTDGSIGPKAAPMEVALSPGGAGSAGTPIVKAGQNGSEIGLKWPADLPEPTLSQDTATYSEVLPGVDLKVQAVAEGYAETVVIKTPQAAANPALTSVPFGLYTKNTTVDVASGEGRGKPTTPGPSDGLEVKDSTGAVLFNGDAARMWDSSGAGSDAEAQLGTGGGRHEAVMGVALTKDKVTLSPDQAFLTSPTTTYPVSLDPDNWCTSCGIQAHDVVQSGYPDQANYNATTGDMTDLKAGYEDYDRAGTSRSYVQMSTAALAGTVVNSATLNTTITHTYSCAPTATDLAVTGGIGGGTTWNNQPGEIYFSGSNNVANCHDAPNVIGQFGATRAAQDAANGRWGSVTFKLTADDPGSGTASWRRFSLNPYLQVNYDSYPNNPTNLSAQHGLLPCTQGANRPWVFTRTPQIQGQVSDPDGGTLTAFFSLAPGTGAAGAHNGSVTVGTPGQNQSATAQLGAVPPDWITSDGTYNWSMYASDGQLRSGWAGNCEFTVDSAVPLAPALAMTGTPPVNQGDPAAYSVWVTMATTGLYDIDHFIYTTDGSEPQPQGSPTAPATQGTDALGRMVATTTLSTLAVNGNQNLIKVKAVNKAGTPGPDAVCTGDGLDGPSCSYHVQPMTPGKGLVGAWSADDATGRTLGDTAASTPGNGAVPAHSAAVTGGATWAAGYNHGNSWTHPDTSGYSDGTKGALALDGSSAYAATSGQVLNTASSFSVAAWARVDDTGAAHTVVSQDGAQNSGFALGYAKDVNAWAVTLADTDQATSIGVRVASPTPPQVGVWTHLVATYDATTKAMTLYVNGVAQKTAVLTTWASAGALVIGAGKWHGARTDFFRGQVDDVQAWQRVLSGQDVHDLASTAAPLANYSLAEGCGPELASATSAVPSLAGNWALGETAGSVAKDSSAGAYDLTMTGGSTWAAGHSGGAAHFDGVSGHGTAAGPVVTTTNSFTVSAWVKPDDLNGNYAVATQGGAHAGAFELRYSHDVNRWTFGMTGADDASSTFTSAVGTSTPQAGAWALVTGVFDRAGMQMKLYVNGKREAVTPLPASWNAGGAFQIGSLLSRQDLFKGSVDQVQAWGTALSEDQIAALNGSAYYDSVSQTSAVATGGVALGTERDGAGNPTGCAAQFDKFTAGHVTLPRPATLRTDKSYTVEAWVNHTWTAADVAAQGPVDPLPQAAVGVDDVHFSPFLLEYRSVADTAGKAHGKWTFLVSNAAVATGAWLMESDSDAAVNTWTHLVGVYDGAVGTAALYVNGVKQNTVEVHTSTPVVTGWNGAGSLFIGRGTWDSAPSDQWYRGSVAGVRVYSGARAEHDMVGDRAKSDPTALFLPNS